MDANVDVQKLNLHATGLSAQFLKGILKVLTDMHIQEMSVAGKEEYIKELADDMRKFKDFLHEASKPGNS